MTHHSTLHAAETLRNAGLIEVDVTGFSTLEDNLQTTSLFLSGQLRSAAPDDAQSIVPVRQSRIQLERAGN